MLKSLIKSHEGLRLKVYTDTLGHPSIGYGRALDVTGITEREAEMLLDADLTRAINGARRVYGEDFGSLSTVRQAALVDMCFQLGEAGLGKFVNMLQAAQSGDWDYAARSALQSKWAKQTPKRARRIAAMLQNDQWPENIEASDGPRTSLKGSRTIAGAQLATGGTVAGTATAAVSDQLTSISDTLSPIVHYSKWIALAFAGVTLIGLGIIVYSRWDDFHRGAQL